MKSIPLGTVFCSKNNNPEDNHQYSMVNHVAIWIGNGIVEAQEKEGVIFTELSEYLARDYTYFLLYPRDFNIGIRAAAYAKTLIGTKYRFIASAFNFLRRDSRGHNCISMVRACYKYALGQDRRWKTPDDLAADNIIFKRNI